MVVWEHQENPQIIVKSMVRGFSS